MPNIDFDEMREILRQFDVSSAIDVALIAMLVYVALRLVSGTRAMTQLRGGMLLVLGAVLVARIFDLRTIRFLIENSLTVVVIVAAIVFQPELRRLLDRLGRTGFRGLLDRNDFRSVADAVARAAGRLSAQRHGGLIVLERRTGLGDVIETGVRLDSRVTPELLTTIFFPNTALHDMAVVMRGDRVVAAGCVLPLTSELSDGNRMLGTRHRAALGVTEASDAVAVVVSEETGGISVAVSGRLIPVADERRLQAVLEWLLNPDGVEQGPAPSASGQVAPS